MLGISEHATDVVSDIQSTNLLDYWLDRLDDIKNDVRKRTDNINSPVVSEVFREFPIYDWKKGLERSSLNDTKDDVKEQTGDIFPPKVPEVFREFMSPFTESTRDIPDEKLQEVLDNEYKQFLFDWANVGAANCMAFASGFAINPYTGKYFSTRPSPGDISGQYTGDYMPDFDLMTRTMNEKEIRETLEKYWHADCEVCGKELIHVASGEVDLKDGERLVAMMYGDTDEYGADFHFLLKGQHGTWYHKPGLAAVRRTDDLGEIIYNPQDCHLKTYNHFCGYYIIRDKA